MLQTIQTKLILGFTFTFFFLQALLHFIRPDIHIFSGFISDYGLGTFGFIFSLSLVCLSIAKVFLVLKLVKSINQKSILLNIAIFFISISAIATTMVAMFPTDPGGNVTTTIGQIHITSAIITFSSSALYFIFLALLQQTQLGQKKARILIAILNTAGFLFLALTPAEYKGLGERVFLLTVTIGIVFYALIKDKQTTTN